MIIKLGQDINTDVGNKAKFLSDMKAEGFNVPDGIVLDKDTYKSVIKNNNLDIKINELLNSITKENIQEISQKISEKFLDIRIEDKLKEEIKRNLNENKRYAVRSSGMKEDLENFSFAGQYDTLLNVQGINNIEEAIVLCYKSMFSETVLSYLMNNKIKLNDLYMSVIIQEMVDSEFSGVVFTLNPLTGNDKQMLIEIAPGFSKIQLYFGYPCDIEFAIKDNILYILQARKVTSIKYMDIEDMWSTADFKDGGVSATVCSPYMWSLYEYIWEFTLRKFMLDSKILKESDLNRKLGDMFYGRCYWNMSVVKLAMSQVVGYKEREFDSEYGVKINYEGDGQITKVTPGSLVKIARIALAQRKILRERNTNAENFWDRKENIYINEEETAQKGAEFLYNTLLGRILLRLIFASRWFSKSQALYQSSKLSKRKIKPFIQKYNINMNLYDNIERYNSFRDFFLRKRNIKNEIDEGNLNKKNLLAIADSKLQVIFLDEQSILKIKNSTYDLNDLLQDDKLSEKYRDGTCLIYRLSLHDYHRYHFLDNGKLIYTKYIKGKLHTVRSISGKYNVYSKTLEK